LAIELTWKSPESIGVRRNSIQNS